MGRGRWEGYEVCVCKVGSIGEKRSGRHEMYVVGEKLIREMTRNDDDDEDDDD